MLHALLFSKGKGSPMNDQTQNGQKAPRSAMAITGLVLGIIALVTSFMPFINNLSFILAVLGAIFSIVGVVGCMRGKRAGKVMAIVALVLNVAACAAVLLTQGAYSKAIDDATNGATVAKTSEASADKQNASDTSASKTDDEQDVSLGASVTLSDGSVITVDQVETGLTADYVDGTFTRVHVSIVNNGSDSKDYSSYNWKGEDAQGAQRDTGYFADAADELSYGKLSAGGNVSGNIYFEGDIAKVVYYDSVISDKPTASWTLS